MKRNIIEINKDKCIGCGLCANACHQGAIQIIDKKATLVSDSYCDGLGMCLPACPVDAIKIVEKDTEIFDETRRGHAKKLKHTGGCPGSANRVIEPKEASDNNIKTESVSQLRQWPVQLNLINPDADFFNGADILVAADCCAYAYANFHQDIMKNKITVIGCPKLDDVKYYAQKLTHIFSNNNIKSITVARMSVPCCGGIVNAVKEAILSSGTKAEYKEIIVSTDGKI